MPDRDADWIASIIAGYLGDTVNLRRLAGDLVKYSVMSKHCGYPTDVGIVPDAAHAALMLEFLADALDAEDD